MPSALSVRVAPIEYGTAVQTSLEDIGLQPARPDRLLLGTLSDLGFRVIKPIEVQIEGHEGGVVASWPQIEEFGTGVSVSYAVEDLGRTVAELYRTLHLDQGRLGPDLQDVWEKLQEFVVPRR